MSQSPQNDQASPDAAAPDAAPDTINLWDSSIVKQQVLDLAQKGALLIGSLAVIFGVVVPPEKIALIAAALVAASGMGFSALTLWHRLKRPCPPIVPKTVALAQPLSGTTSVT